MPPATATAASEPPPLFLLPPLPAQPGVPLLRELCLDKVAAEPAASLACVARGKGWQRLPAPLRLQLLGALGERHALSDALLERLLPAGASVEQPSPAALSTQPRMRSSPALTSGSRASRSTSGAMLSAAKGRKRL